MREWLWVIARIVPLGPELALMLAWLSMAVVFGACSTAAQDPAVTAVNRNTTELAAAVNETAVLARLPTLERWQRHVRDEILPFWTHPDALADGSGDFPTFRCNDGSKFDPGTPCPELGQAPSWIARELGTEYTRMKSRQTFTYGVGFHITGDPLLLAHARAGVEHLRRYAYEPSGSAITWHRNGQSGPPAGQRTVQDLAYAQLGLAFYYYLTRDPEVLADLERLHRRLFDDYWEPSWGMLRWVLEDGPAGSAEQQELVAQLDPINAYLLLLTPLLDSPQRARWQADLGTLSKVIKTRFYGPETGLFWGAIHAPEHTQLGTRHTDFGHSAKSLWMIWLAAGLGAAGEQAERQEVTRFAADRAQALLTRAALPSGCWGSGVDREGTVQTSSNWWTSAELDQLAATLALADPARREAMAAHLGPSYACWLERFVDRTHHGIYPFLSPAWPAVDGAAIGAPKVFHWKSGYHEIEHALIALITTAGLRGKSLPLYFAFHSRPPRERIQPYYYRGRIAAEMPLALPGTPALTGVQIHFADIR